MRILVGLVFLTMLAGAVYAADQPEPATTPTITFECSDTAIPQALSELAQKAQVSILADGSAKGNLTMNLNNVTVEQVLTMICKQNKLTWMKVYASPSADTGKLNANKIFEMIDTLKSLGGSAVMWDDPESESKGIFAPSVKPETLEKTPIAQNLKLKPVYLVRAVPEEKPAGDTTAKKDQKPQMLSMMAPPPDPRAAASIAWSYFSQMPTDVRMRAMHDMREMAYQSMTPQEREAMYRSFRDRRNGDGRQHNHN